MTIAQVSQKYGLSQDTLRYYERIGLIPPVPRNKSGIRDYDEVSCRMDRTDEMYAFFRCTGRGID